MLYEEAKACIRERYDKGERDIRVPYDTYYAYKSGTSVAEYLTALERAPHDEYLYYKAGVVRLQS